MARDYGMYSEIYFWRSQHYGSEKLVSYYLEIANIFITFAEEFPVVII